MGMKPAASFDQRYKETCAQLGQAYLKRLDLASQLDSLDSEIAMLKEAAHQHIAAHRAARETDTYRDLQGAGHE